MTHFNVLIHQMSFTLPTGKSIFNNLTLTLAKQKIGLVGRNGVGKSTLIKLIMGELHPSTGSIYTDSKLAYVPQQVSLPEHLTVADVFGYGHKIMALQRVISGSTDENDFVILNEEWEIEDRLQRQLSVFGLQYLPFNRPLQQLSGGEVTRLMLSKAFCSDADFLLLDEPTNHLDYAVREQLYAAIKKWQGGLIIISHDRTLLNLMEEIVELTSLGVSNYGGNYDDYAQQKAIEDQANQQHLQDAKKFIQKSKSSVQASYEKHEQKQSYGRELRRSGKIDKLAANSKKGRSERTQSKMLIKEQRMIEQAESQLKQAQEKIEINEEIHIDLPETKVPNGKMILEIDQLSFSYHEASRIIDQFDLILQGPERIALSGDNGSGKTTLIKLVLGELPLQAGTIHHGTNYISYLDQNASLLNPQMTILENFMRLNPDATENDSRSALAQFLFRNVSSQIQVQHLSGGEKLRALLASVLMAKHPPQLLILDEPTNHLDLHSIRSIELALKNYQGAMIVISHDKVFLKNVGIERVISAPFKK